MANIKGIIVEIGGDTSKLQNALKKVNSSTASLSKELKGINSLLKLDPKNTEMLSQKQTVLKQNIEQTFKKLEELKNAQEMADNTIANGGKISQENYRNLQREILVTENKLNNLKAEASNWTKAGRSIEEFGNKVANISNKVDKLGSTLTTRLTLPIAGIATGLISSAKEFETAFTGVEKTVDGTATQMANLKQGIKDMAEEIPASTTEISAVAEAAGQLGIQTDNILTFTKTMINMGNATNLSADEAATTLARFANVTKMSQSDFDKLGSVIVALGNNFATTEAEITDMGMNLASAGTQVGMSQSQIMALATALSSVGLEAQAGGTAFSKVMVNMQLAVEKGGKDLKNFASVAGMSTKQFQKAFKEDATNAIMQFVDGLSKSGERGKSAIKILDDMGITETRLRDALLRSANASEVMGKAIELGNKAWKENTALTNEADKRYQTLDSRLQTTKNKILNVATNTGDKLTPSFNKLLDKIDGLIDNFDNLNEEEVTNIIKTGALIAAIGPAIKILGTLGKTVGTGTKAIGTFTQAVGLIGKTSTDAFKKASAGTQTLASGLTFLTSPAGLATAAIMAVATGTAYLAYKQTEAVREANKLAEEITAQKQKYEEYNQSIDQTTKANLAQIDSVSKLKEELTTLVDENGKVKEGYESRVSFILNELNNALGTEYKLNGNIVQSYKDLQGEIDNTIEKKKAEIKLEAYKQKYENAVNTETEAVSKQKETVDKLGMSYDEVREKYGEWIDKYNSKSLTTKDIDNLTQSEYNHRAELAKLSKAYEEQEDVIKRCTEDKKNYENNYALFVEGKYNEIGNTITDTTKNWSNSSVKEIQNSIIKQQQELDKYKQMYERTGSEVEKQQMEQIQQNLQNLANELASRTKTIGDLGVDEISAWRNLANNSYEEYKNAISKVGPEVQQKIQDITGVIVSDTGLSNATSSKATEMTSMFDKKLELGGRTKQEINNSANSLKNDTTVQTETGNLADRAQSEIEKNDSKTWGEDMVEGLGNGIKQKSKGSWFTGILSGLAGTIASFIHFSRPDRGPLREYEKWMPDMIQGLAKTLDSSSPKLLNSASNLSKKLEAELNNMNMPKIQDFGKLQGNLSREIANNTRTVNNSNKITLQIYPQQLTEKELDKAVDYLNKKLGQYM